MIDSTLKELWLVKDEIAKEHDYDLVRLVAYLQSKNGKVHTKFTKSEIPNVSIPTWETNNSTRDSEQCHP